MKTTSVKAGSSSTKATFLYTSAQIKAAQKAAQAAFATGTKISKLPADLIELGTPISFATGGGPLSHLMVEHKVQVATSGAFLYGTDLDTTNATTGKHAFYQLGPDPLISAALDKKTKASASQTERVKNIVAKRIAGYYAKKLDGAVTLFNTPKVYTTANPHIFVAHGTVNNNDGPGGAYNYSYQVVVNLETELIRQIKALKEGAETN